ncbi:PTS glucose transporter subunit IIA [Clostridium sp. BJN0001]|uniref:PTS sugar transporter subunit IIA n=1 Tax=Clostridium sp. BJN0001 TaxID=2930219 RepID=UPI001FD3554C|nr:PTS glucose transporter subunit IIA [Clostridium sp. BJN0001]
MFNLFKKKNIDIKTCAAGWVRQLEEISDEVFSKKMIGDGIAVIPEDGKIYSPIDGTVQTVFPTKHAIVIKSTKGFNLLLHLGINTISLKGEPFEINIKEGDNVRDGDLIGSMDLDFLKKKNVDSTIMIICMDEGNEDNHFIKSRMEDDYIDNNAVIMQIE